MKTNREKALSWWDDLFYIQQQDYNLQINGDRLTWLNLNQIEELYQKESKPVDQQIINEIFEESKFQQELSAVKKGDLDFFTKKQVDFELLQEMYLHIQSGKNTLCGHWMENLQLFIELLAKSSTFAHKAHKELKKLNM